MSAKNKIVKKSTAILLQEMDGAGVYAEMMRRGMLTTCVVEYRKIYDYYMWNINFNKMRKSRAVTETATQFNVDRSKVYRAIRQMK